MQGAALPLTGQEILELEQGGNSRQVRVMDLLPGFDDTLASDLASSGGAGLVGFLASEPYADGTIGGELNKIIDRLGDDFETFEDWGMVGDYVDQNNRGTDNQAAYRAMLTSGKTQFRASPGKKYYLGVLPAYGVQVSHGKPMVIDYNGAELIFDIAAPASGVVHRFYDTPCVALNFVIRNLKPVDVDPNRGLVAFNFFAKEKHTSGYVVVGKAYNCQSLVTIQSDPTTNPNHSWRISDVKVDVVTYDCYYGINCANNGDQLRGRCVSSGHRRAYFVYGVSNHDVLIFSLNQYVSTNDFIVTNYGVGPATTNINARLIKANWYAPALIGFTADEGVNSSAMVIRGVRVSALLFAGTKQDPTAFEIKHQIAGPGTIVPVSQGTLDGVEIEVNQDWMDLVPGRGKLLSVPTNFARIPRVKVNGGYVQQFGTQGIAIVTGEKFTVSNVSLGQTVTMTTRTMLGHMLGPCDFFAKFYLVGSVTVSGASAMFVDEFTVALSVNASGQLSIKNQTVTRTANSGASAVTTSLAAIAPATLRFTIAGNDAGAAATNIAAVCEILARQ
ncbi:hypothetical protein [Pseudomonas phage Persinger]|uniref:Uncharacterized protein n=1 Tax=Pseudomonas phage Persinger TaxID=2749430 RepID=A0A7D7ESR3_9CAUD|nr:hypothetical protein KB682_gp53 [Pseudomonas phage Persinger]QMP19178.1 hypothetical protein [Pseudomonas phage Persinger]